MLAAPIEGRAEDGECDPDTIAELKYWVEIGEGTEKDAEILAACTRGTPTRATRPTEDIAELEASQPTLGLAKADLVEGSIDESLSVALTAEPLGGGEAMGAPVVNDWVVFPYERLYPVWYKTYTVAAGQPLTFETVNLAPIPGSTHVTCGGWGADTFVAIVNTSTGDLMAQNDDRVGGAPGDYSSKVVWTPASAGSYRFLVYAYGYTAGNVPCSQAGLADVKLMQTGGPNETTTSQLFGGITVGPRTLRTGDVLFGGKLPTGLGWTTDPGYHDLVVHSLSGSPTPCVASGGGTCGLYATSDDFGGTLLPKLSVTQITTEYRVVLGGYPTYTWGGGSPARWVNGRLVHLRVGAGWNDDAEVDHDGDGLTYHAELELGTCDLLDASDLVENVGVQGMSCQSYRDWLNGYVATFSGQAAPCPVGSYSQCTDVPVTPGHHGWCWHPCDSDNDSLRDDEEVFIRRTACTQAPADPMNSAGTCSNVRFVDAQSGAYTVSLALSAEDQPDPTVPDSFLELDSFYFADSMLSTALSASQLQRLRDPFEVYGMKCWDGSPPPCVGVEDRAHRFKVHVVQETRTVPYKFSNNEGVFYWSGGVEQTHASFNRLNGASSFPGKRKYTDVYKYGVLSWDFGGQKQGRNFIVGNDDQTDGFIGQTVAHEFGHTHGVPDLPFFPTIGTTELCPVGSGSPTRRMAFAHPSIMNAEFYSAGLGYAPLEDIVTSTGPCSNINARFSKGLGNSVVPSAPGGGAAVLESAFYEQGPSSWAWRRLAFDLRCYRDLGCKAQRFSSASCTANQCCINWDEDAATCEPTSQSKDLDRDDSWNATLGAPGTDGNGQNDPVPDRNDWAEMLVKFFDANEDSEGWYDVLATGFNDGTNGFNFAGWAGLVGGAWSSVAGSYPANICDVDADCESATCRRDACATSATCRQGTACSEGTCNCTTDADCWSGRCLAPGFCDTSGGVCACTSGYQCKGLGCNGPQSTCTASFSLFGNAAQLAGSGSNHEVRLLSGGSGNPVDGLDADVDYELDFKPVGVAEGQTEQRLVSGRFFRVTLLPQPADRYSLVVQNNAGTTLITYPQSGQPLLARGTWYSARISHASSGGKLFLELRAWSGKTVTHWIVTQPWHSNYALVTCLYRTGLTMPSSGGNVVFGASSIGTQRFNGQLENVHVFKGARTPDSAFCTQVTQ